jgi:glutathione S-transferase
MQEPVLYDNPGSSNALKVRFLIEELGLHVRRVVVPLDDPRPAEYLAVHPFGTVPALVDGDLRLVESNTILRYLADREGREDLYPRDPAGRARVDQLLDVLSLAVRPALWEVELRTHYAETTGAPVDAADLAACRAALDAAVSGWERLIEPDGYLTGTFSIADIAACARLWLFPELGLDADRYPRTAAMLAVVGARHAYRAALRPVA